ncbi:NAD(P)-binding protein [Aspergillus cavernicola]|uniref:NAD(P)-binding protein n=1 Tax=Aspergillus cavernicola TaxID=176166 RepID=A0ABR4I6W0_9EURO
MPFYNTYPGFLYRQFFICPSRVPSSLSLHGRAGMVTGANTGLGYHASLQLLNSGLSRLILAVRNVAKGEAARETLLASVSESNKPPIVEVWELDLASYSSITAFVERLKQSGIHLDFAILNAGVANFTYGLNASTGHEDSIQINWLSTALLTLLLMPVLDQQAAANNERPRPIISIVGSETAAWAKFKEAQTATEQQTSLVKALDAEGNFDMTDRYYTSKLLYQLFFLELVRNHRSSALRASGTVLNIVNPGFCYGSELHRGVEGALGMVLGGMKRVVGRSVSMGARTLVHAAVLAGAESNGKYLSDNRPAPFAGYGDRLLGRTTQGEVWDETVTELRSVVDMTKLLSEI